VKEVRFFSAILDGTTRTNSRIPLSLWMEQ